MTAEERWKRWLEVGLGIMGMRAADFWALSFREWSAAQNGFLQRLGQTGDVTDIMTRRELNALIEVFG